MALLASYKIRHSGVEEGTDLAEFCADTNKVHGLTGCLALKPEMLVKNIPLKTYYKLLSNAVIGNCYQQNIFTSWGVHLFCLGKFGQNIEKTQTAFVSYQEDLEKLVYNANLEIKNVVLIGQAAMQVNYQTKGSRVVPSRATQIIHAGMVTALSRIELDVAMREILNIEGSRILYADTGNFCVYLLFTL